MRVPLPKSLRFEVLKRDGFTCQYCGARAPDVALHVDHRLAVVAGGKNTAANLITACADCNMGKGARHLDVSMEDRAAIKRLAPSLESQWSPRIVRRELEAWQGATGVPIEVMLEAARLASDWEDFYARYWRGVTDYWAAQPEDPPQ